MEAERVARRAAALLTALRDGHTALARALVRARAEQARLIELAGALRSLAQQPERKPTRRASVRFDTLSPRQRQVLERIVAGQANKVVAFDLGVSEKTVETHRARIMQKLGATSFAELVRIALPVLEGRLAEIDGGEAIRREAAPRAVVLRLSSSGPGARDRAPSAR